MADITSGSTYSESKFGTVQRTFFKLKTDVATVGTTAENYISLPVKAKIVGFGVQSAASTITSSTDRWARLSGTKAQSIRSIPSGQRAARLPLP